MYKEKMETKNPIRKDSILLVTGYREEIKTNHAGYFVVWYSVQLNSINFS